MPQTYSDIHNQTYSDVKTNNCEVLVLGRWVMDLCGINRPRSAKRLLMH